MELRNRAGSEEAKVLFLSRLTFSGKNFKKESPGPIKHNTLFLRSDNSALGSEMVASFSLKGSLRAYLPINYGSMMTPYFIKKQRKLTPNLASVEPSSTLTAEQYLINPCKKRFILLTSYLY